MSRVSADHAQETEPGAAGTTVASPPASATPLGSLAWASAVGNRAVQRYARRRVLARVTPQEILEQYQVHEDTVEEWSPKAWGVIPIPGAGSRMLTSTEGALLDSLTVSRGLVGLSAFKDIAEDASGRARREYPHTTALPSYVPAERDDEWRNNDGHRDAFRHCFWNARLTKEFGIGWTRQFTTAHEALPDNSAARESMDLWNNERGREIARDNPDASVDELATLVKAAVTDGRLVVVDQAGNLAWSNAVALWEHGLAPEASRAGVLAVPAGDASVD